METCGNENRKLAPWEKFTPFSRGNKLMVNVKKRRRIWGSGDKPTLSPSSASWEGQHQSHTGGGVGPVAHQWLPLYTLNPCFHKGKGKKEKNFVGLTKKCDVNSPRPSSRTWQASLGEKQRETDLFVFCFFLLYLVFIFHLFDYFLSEQQTVEVQSLEKR